jgi:hypothetical protein
MAFPTASGAPSHSGTLIPKLWAKKALIKFYNETVFTKIANTDYEGEIKDQGDEVIIRIHPDITVRKYVKGLPLQRENPKVSTVSLLIDKGLYYNFNSSDVDVKQSDQNFVNEWATNAGIKLKEYIDAEVLADIYVDAHAKNSGATAGAKSGTVNLGVTGTPVDWSTGNKILSSIMGIAQVLNEQNVPDFNRWVTLPAWAWTKLLESDLKQVDVTGDAKSTLRNGQVGVINNMTILRSNQLASVYDSSASKTCWNIIAGSKHALTFATQIVKAETLRNPDDFGDMMRGLQVYGYKVVKPEALVHAYVKAA